MKIPEYRIPLDVAVMLVRAGYEKRFMPLTDAVVTVHLAPPMTWLRQQLSKPL